MNHAPPTGHHLAAPDTHHLAPATAPHPLDAPFSPPRAKHGEILSAIANPYNSLAGIAAEHNTSVDALCLWLCRPEVQRRFNAVKGASAERAPA